MVAKKEKPVGMDLVLRGFASQIRTGYDLSKKIGIQGNIQSIAIGGMGGSALPGEILDSYLEDIQIPIYILKDYKIPAYINSNTLFFSISYSGNTEETLESFKEAWRKGAKLVVIASGGKLVDLGKEKHAPIVLVPEGLQPRMAYGYMFFAMLRILENSKIIPSQEKEVERTVKLLTQSDFFVDKAEEFVNRVEEETPLIYTSAKLKVIGYKWKINFNETAKKFAFYNIIPEMNHNELMGFLDDHKNYFVFLIKDSTELKAVNKRFEATKQIIKKQGIDVAEISLSGDSRLSKIFSAIYIGDWLAYLLAIKYDKDPNAVVLIEDLKQKLSKM